MEYRIVIIVLICLQLLLVTEVICDVCHTPLLRDVLSNQQDIVTYLRNTIGDTMLITGLPVIDGEHFLTLRNFGSDVFLLPILEFEGNTTHPDYWFTAVEVQFGSVTHTPQYCTGRNNTYGEVALSVSSDGSSYSPVDLSYEKRTNANGRVLGLTELGSTSFGRIARINFPPIRGIKFQFSFSGQVNVDFGNSEACLRIEVYGCRRESGASSPPAVNTSPLLQYNTLQSTATIYGHTYTDASYNGRESYDYLSGGVGVLTDGVISNSPIDTPSQWMGWSAGSPQMLLLLFQTGFKVSQLQFLFWIDAQNNIGAPVNISITDQSGSRYNGDSVMTTTSSNVKITHTWTVPVAMQYADIRMEYSSNTILMSEVVIIDDNNNSTVPIQNNIVTPSPTTTTTITNPSATSTPTTTSTSTPTTSTPIPTTNTNAITTTANTNTIAITTTATNDNIITSTGQTNSITDQSHDTTTATSLISSIVSSNGVSNTTSPMVTTLPPNTTDSNNNSNDTVITIIGISVVLILIIILIIIVSLLALLLLIRYILKRRRRGVDKVTIQNDFTKFDNSGIMNYVSTEQHDYEYITHADVTNNNNKNMSSSSISSAIKNNKNMTSAIKNNKNMSSAIKSNKRESKVNEWYEMDVTQDSDKDSFDNEDDDITIYASPEELNIIALNQRNTSTSSYEQVYIDNVYDISPIYASVHKFNTTEELTTHMSIPPISSIYEDPQPLLKEEGPLHITWSEVQETQLLGHGQFGEVWLATLPNHTPSQLKLTTASSSSSPATAAVTVALKKLMHGATREIKEAFSKEIKFMTRLDHPNVIRLVGVCLEETDEQRGRFILMEYMPYGDLAQYLLTTHFKDTAGTNIRENEINADCMVYMGLQISAGMDYLSSKNFIHRDLSARNCLVGSNYTIKVADFGMSQNLYTSQYFKISGKATLPIRWMASECFYGKFSVKTDVWAFGVTLWEIASKGERPYPHMTDMDIIQDVIQNKERRARLTKPRYATNSIWQLVMWCCEMDPNERPGFDMLCSGLRKLCHFNINSIVSDS